MLCYSSPPTYQHKNRVFPSPIHQTSTHLHTHTPYTHTLYTHTYTPTHTHPHTGHPLHTSPSNTFIRYDDREMFFLLLRVVSRRKNMINIILRVCIYLYIFFFAVIQVMLIRTTNRCDLYYNKMLILQRALLPR